MTGVLAVIAVLIIAVGLIALVWRAFQGLERISDQAQRAHGEAGHAAGVARHWRTEAERAREDATRWRRLVIPDEPGQQPMPLTRRIAEGKPRARFDPPPGPAVVQPTRTQQDPIDPAVAGALTVEMEAVAAGPTPRRRGHLAPVRPQADES